MRFSVGPTFSYELTNRAHEPVFNFTKKLNLFFENKNYGERVEVIYCGVICVSEGFAPLVPVRPLKVLRKEPAIEFEYSLDFNTYQRITQDDRESYVAKEYLQVLSYIFQTKKVKGFNSSNLVIDLTTFVNQVYLLK